MSQSKDNQGRSYRLNETRTIPKPRSEVFAYAGEFANIEKWDPGIESSKKAGNGETGVGTMYRVESVMAGKTIPMDYTVRDWQPDQRVELFGRGEGFTSVDIIEFEDAPDGGTLVKYEAEITLYNFLRFLGPLMNIPFNRLGEHALDGLVESLS